MALPRIEISGKDPAGLQGVQKKKKGTVLFALSNT